LHQNGAKSQLGGDGSDLTRVVRLHASDGHESVAPLIDGVRREIFEFARLVAAERDSRVYVLSLRPQFDLPAEVFRQTVEAVDWRSPESEVDSRGVF
jgi:hypothetical protein